MSLIWHIVKKDFRRLAVPLALWAVVLIIRGEIGVHVLTSQGEDVNRLFYWSIANTMLFWIDAVVCVLLVAALVHEDTLVGASAAWATRPISGSRLLAAKMSGALLMFGVLPIAVAVRWWLVCGYDGAEMVRAAVAIADVQFVTVFAALLLATLTKNINEFLGWALGLGLALIVWSFVLSAVVKGFQVELTRGVSETRNVLLVVFVTIGGAAVVVTQFLTRRRKRALAVAAVAAASIALVFMNGWDLSSIWARAPRTSLLASGLTITVENPKTERQAAMDVVLRGVPADFAIRASADHVWRWSDGATAAAQSGAFTGSWAGAAEWRSLGPHAGTANEIMMQAYAAYAPKSVAPKDGSIVPMKFLLWAEKAERLRTEPASYTGNFHVTLLRPKLEFELPSHNGEKREQAGVSVRIDRAVWGQGQWRLVLVESRPAWTAYGRRRPSLATLTASDAGPATGFALVNRTRGEAVKLWPNGTPVTRLLVGTQELAWYSMQCDLPRDPVAEKSDAPPTWLKDATLAVVRYHEEAVFDREVKVEKFGAPAKVAAK